MTLGMVYLGFGIVVALCAFALIAAIAQAMRGNR